MIDRERQILERLELDNPQELKQYAASQAKVGRARLAENIPDALQTILDRSRRGATGPCWTPTS